MADKNELTITAGMTQAEFGTALLTEATNRKQRIKFERSITEAETILARLEDCDRQIEHLSGWKKTCEGQMKALQDGAFSFDKDGSIVYEDKSLNRR